MSTYETRKGVFGLPNKFRILDKSRTGAGGAHGSRGGRGEPSRKSKKAKHVIFLAHSIVAERPVAFWVAGLLSAT